MKTLKHIVSAILLISSLSASAQALIPQFSAGNKVAFIGDSITHGGHYHSYIWLFYMTRFPDMPIWIYNCGVGGDTSENILNRLDADVFDKKPDYLMLTFGMNDTGYMDVFNKPESDSLSAARIEHSRENFLAVADRLKNYRNDVPVVMLGGSPYDETMAPASASLHGKNAAIRKIIDIQKEQAEANGWGFVDFNTPMLEITAAEQQKDSTYSFCPADRVHPDKDGQMVMAYLFLKAQGLSGSKVADICIDAKHRKVRTAENCSVSALSASGEGVKFDYLAKSLPYPCDSISENGWGNIHSQRNALKLVPFTEEFNRELLAVKGLKEGNYLLRIDGQPLKVYTSSELEAGVNLAELTDSPQYRQASAVMYLNSERFEVEKRLREYVWMEFTVFQDSQRRFVDNWESIETVNEQAANNWFVSSSNYWYRKSYFPAIRETWENYMKDIVDKIYQINKPVSRVVSLEKVD